ncbi:MAG: hypothetical protein ACI9JM_000400 [Halioglobus sp.]|jgi:hypothetical protein
MDRSPQTALYTFISALLALFLSGLILLAAFASYTSSEIPEGANRDHETVITGSSMRAIAGTAEAQGEQLRITGWEPQGEDHRAIAVSSTRFRAENYPLVSTQLDGDYPGPMLRLVWRTATDGGMNAVVLNRTDDGSSRVYMANHPQWRGSVVEIGIYSVTRDTDQKFAITRLTLEPHSWRGVLSSYLTSWTAYRGWTLRSVNFLYGTADVFAQSPVEVVAIWCMLAIGLLLLVSRVTSGAGLVADGGSSRPDRGSAIVGVVLIAWVSLDLLWQKELTARLEATTATFAGKTLHEKHLVDIDGYLYSYIKRISEEVLPEKPARIILLHDSTKHNFQRLKSGYYLLPHNVYNFGKRPPKQGLRKGDYILSLGDSDKVEFNAKKSTLIGNRGKPPLSVRILDEDPMGTLYQLTADPKERYESNSAKSREKKPKGSSEKKFGSSEIKAKAKTPGKGKVK